MCHVKSYRRIQDPAVESNSDLTFLSLILFPTRVLLFLKLYLVSSPKGQSTPYIGWERGPSTLIVIIWALPSRARFNSGPTPLHITLIIYISLPTSHPTAYGKSVMNKYMKTENTQKRYLSTDFPVLKFLTSRKVNPY